MYKNRCAVLFIALVSVLPVPGQSPESSLPIEGIRSTEQPVFIDHPLARWVETEPDNA